MSTYPEAPEPTATGPGQSLVPGYAAGASRASAPGFDALGDPYRLGMEPGPAAVASGFSIVGVLRYKWTILGIALPLIAVLASAIWLLVIPQYHARAEIRVRPIIPRLVFPTEDNGIIPLYQNYLNTQVSVVRSPTVLERVLDRRDVRETSWYKAEATLLGKTLPPMERLRKALEVAPRGKTELIDVGMSCRNGKDAARIVNAVLEEYIKFVRETSDQTDDQIYRALTAEFNSRRAEIAGLEAGIVEIRKELGTGDPEELLAKKRVRLDAIEAERQTLERELRAIEWQRQRLVKAAENRRKAASSRPSSMPASELRYELDPEWRELRARLRTAQHELDVNGERLGASHPKMAGLRKGVELAWEMLTEREQQLDTQSQLAPSSPAPFATGKGVTGSEPSLQALSYRADLLRYQLDLVLKNLEEARKSFDQTFTRSQDLVRQTDEIRHKREMYQAVRTRLERKAMERNVPGSIKILARAIPPSKPSRDRRRLLTVVAVVFGVGAGIGVAFLRANFTPLFYDARDVPEAVSAPFLGQLPLFEDMRNQSMEELAAQSEYLRMARTAILQRLDPNRGNVILVTSAEPQAGKSTVAALLAESLARCGKRVLLIDTDLRRPSLARQFKVEGGPGLLGALRDNVSDADVIVPTGMDRLSVLPAGDTGPNNQQAELLANGAFANALTRWRKEFDVVLLDSPPVLPVADARILARQADGTIMVVKEGHCRRGDVVDALGHLVTAGARLMGTVFIGTLRRNEYQRKYYYRKAEAIDGHAD